MVVGCSLLADIDWNFIKEHTSMICTRCKQPIKKTIAAYKGGMHMRCAIIDMANDPKNHYEVGTLGWLLKSKYEDEDNQTKGVEQK